MKTFATSSLIPECILSLFLHGKLLRIVDSSHSKKVLVRKSTGEVSMSSCSLVASPADFDVDRGDCCVRGFLGQLNIQL